MSSVAYSYTQEEPKSPVLFFFLVVSYVMFYELSITYDCSDHNSKLYLDINTIFSFYYFRHISHASGQRVEVNQLFIDLKLKSKVSERITKKHNK